MNSQDLHAPRQLQGLVEGNEKEYNRGSQQLGEARVVDYGEDIFCGTPICRPREGILTNRYKQRLSGVQWNIAFAIDRCTYELAWQIT